MKKQCLLLIPAMLCLAGCNTDKDGGEQPAAPTVTAISVSALPKITYKSGEKLDLTGLKVEASLSDESKKDVSTFTTDADTEKTLRVGKEEVKISYSEGEKTFETSFDVTVNTYFHVDYAVAKANYTDPITISPMDGVTIDNTNHVITFAPAAEKTKYTISGYFQGQLLNTVKNTELELSNAYIENDGGVSCIYGIKKTCVSMKNGTVNYLIMNGSDSGEFYSATMQTESKDMEFGGSGTGYIISTEKRCAKCDEFKMKGSGNFYFEGSQDESVINCNTFLVETEKSFNAYISNGKNGIKADEGINVSSGTIYLSDCKTGLKCDISKDESNPNEINLLGGTIYNHLCETLYSCGENCFYIDEDFVLGSY